MNESELNNRIRSLKRRKYPMEDAVRSFFEEASAQLLKKSKNIYDIGDKLIVLSVPGSILFFYLVIIYTQGR